LRRHQPQHGRKREQGIVITLVAVFMASVVLVMAALAIDLTTLYTARSEAQLAADSAALAAARVLANSGMTSSDFMTPPFDTLGAETLATTVAMQVAASNQIGGKNLVPPGGGISTCNGAGAQISVCFHDSDVSNPYVTVQVTRPDLPTFFLRFWKQQLPVSASATAEAYNPSGLSTSRRHGAAPVAPICVKPWLLPNLDPTQTGAPSWVALFDRRHGTIENPNLIGQTWPNTYSGTSNTSGLLSQSPGPPYTTTPAPGQYYPIDPADLPATIPALPSCSNGFTNYQLEVAGCVPQPIACGRNATIRIDTAAYANRDSDTVAAVQCLIHYNTGAGDTDSIVGEPALPTLPPATITPPFEFEAGGQNPLTTARGQDVLVSDSLVTIPVYDTGATSGNQPGPPPNPVTVIGFLQVFLNPQSNVLPYPLAPTQIPVTIINQIGCGIDSSGTPVYGNGPSAVPVRLITPP
jgi:hypothetical protein